MNTVKLATLLLWSAVCIAAEDSEQQCFSSSMQIFLKSRRNETGYWKSTVTFRQSEDEPTEEWEVEVGQTSHGCGKHKATLETTFHFTAPPPKTAVVLPTRRDPPPPAKVVPDGYTLYAGLGYYKFHHDVTTWNVARARCEAEGAYLMIINSQPEAEVLKTLFNLNPTSPGSQHNTNVLIGVHKVNGVWVSVAGEPMPSATTPYARWNPGEPNYNDDCVAALRPTTFFNNVGCDKHILAYICEFDLK